VANQVQVVLPALVVLPVLQDYHKPQEPQEQVVHPDHQVLQVHQDQTVLQVNLVVVVHLDLVVQVDQLVVLD
jgi:hypothetical protein